MDKRMKLEHWKSACIKAIKQDKMDVLKKVLGRLDENDNLMFFREISGEILTVAEERCHCEAIDILLGHRYFCDRADQILSTALMQKHEPMAKAALNHCNPNIPVAVHRHSEKELAVEQNMTAEDPAINRYMLIEPLGMCAMEGNVEMAKVLMEHGASPEGYSLSDAFLLKQSPRTRTFDGSWIDFMIHWDDGEQRTELCRRIHQLPPWADAMYCNEPDRAEFFLAMGKDRSSLDLSMAVSMVRSGDIIRLLDQHKPKLMSGVEPKHILRHYWPEAVKAYFDRGREIPQGAIQMMGAHMFEEYDLFAENMKSFKPGLRERDFTETLKYLLKRGYRMSREDLEYLTSVMLIFRSQKLWEVLKGRIPRDMEATHLIDYLPVDEKSWDFGSQLEASKVKFHCTIGENFRPIEMKPYRQMTRLFKLVNFELRDQKTLNRLACMAIMSRSPKSVALLWKKGFLNKYNLNEATKLACEVEATELYELLAELSGTVGGSEVTYEL